MQLITVYLQFITDAPARVRPDAAARPTKKSGSVGALVVHGRDDRMLTHTGRSHADPAPHTSVVIGRPSLKRSMDEMKSMARPTLSVPAAARTAVAPVRSHVVDAHESFQLQPSIRPVVSMEVASSLISRPASPPLPRPSAAKNTSSKWAAFLDDTDDALDLCD